MQDGKFCFINSFFSSTTRYTADELEGKDSLEIVIPEDREMVRENTVRMLKGELPSPYQFRVICRDGNIIWVMATVRSVQYHGRRAVLGNYMEVTERKRMEEALRETEEEKSTFLEEAPVSIIHADLEGRITYVNKRFELESGYPREEIIGKNGLQLGWLSADTTKYLTERMGARLRGDPAKHWETKFKCKDGRSIWIELEGKVLARSGVAIGFQIIATNITERKQAEKALRQSEERYRTILEETGDGYFETELAGNFTFVNDAQTRLLGYSREELIGTNFRTFTPQERVKIVLEAYNRMYKTGEPLRNFVDEVIKKDGSRGFAETSAFPIRNDRGEIVGFRGVRRDITGRKQMEEALRHSEEKYRTILEDMEDAYFEVDLGGHFTFVNNSVCRDLGYSRQELIGMSYKNFVATDHIDSVFRVFNEVYLTDVPNKGFSWKTTRKDGVQGFAETSISLLRNDRGEIIGFRGVGRDVTERKKVEEALKMAAEEWRRTFDSISDPVSIHDRDFRIQRANRAFADLFGKTFHEIIGSYCYELHKANEPRFGCPHQHTLTSGKPATAEFYESHLGKHLLESTSPIVNERGETVGAVHIIRDITEQKQQNERLIMADRLASLGELAAGTAHELNNPLTSIIGFSQLLMEKEVPDDIREDVKLINSEAQRAASVTRNLLTFARKHAPVRELNQINNTIEDVLRLRAHQHKVNCIEVRRHLAPNLPRIMIDYYQMQQVLLNIIMNAEYFMIEAHKKGTLTIATKKQNGSTVRIAIADDGPGIPQENLRRIFDPFFTTKAAGKGTGLGLSICHGTVAEHGGQIYARSQPGEGATIFIELPINGNNGLEVAL